MMLKVYSKGAIFENAFFNPQRISVLKFANFYPVNFDSHFNLTKILCHDTFKIQIFTLKQEI